MDKTNGGQSNQSTVRMVGFVSAVGVWVNYSGEVDERADWTDPIKLS